MQRAVRGRMLFVAFTCLAAALACTAGAAPPRVPATPGASSTRAAAPLVEPTSVLWERSIVVNGVERTYLVYRPTRDVLARVPLVVVVHGLGNTARGIAQQSHFDLQAEQSGFIAIFPQGLDNSFNSGYGCCGGAASNGVDDVAFISKIIDQAQADYLIDTRRVYATGFSNGGFMTYGLACRLGHRLAAVAPVGAWGDAKCGSRRPISVIHLHGGADKMISIAPPQRHLLDDPLQLWAKVNGCRPGRQADGGLAVERTTYGSRCRAGTAVESHVVRGMGHSWPHPLHPSDAAARQQDGTETIWNFFAAHPKV